jgi:hypothetical protein
MNGIGLWTLFGKECRRFSKVWMQTVFSPLVTTSLYFLVFGVALGSRLQEIDGLPYIRFVVPGLILLGVITNSFLNTSSSLFQSKINQTLVDLGYRHGGRPKSPHSVRNAPEGSRATRWIPEGEEHDRRSFVP